MIISRLNISQLISKGMETFKRFPFAVLSSLLTTCIAMYFIEVEPHELKGVNLLLMKLAATAMLGVFVFTAFRLLEQNFSKKGQIFALLISVIGLIGYYFSLPDEMQGFDAMIYIFKHIFLIVLFFVAMLWTPFIKSNLSNVDYWEYAKEVLFSLVMTVLFSIVVIIGVNMALYAVEELFDFYIKGKYYFMIDVFIVGVFSVAYFLSQVPEKPLASKAILPPLKVEKFFTQYILTPLTGLYFVILYSYTAKVLVTMDWPKGILAWLIVAFSIVAVLTYLFWTHFPTHANSKWRRWIWLAILLQTFMLFAAIGMRIAEYSWTENRYMVLLLGVWLAGISFYFLVKKEAKIKWIFVSLSSLIAISQVGPLSAYNVSKKAQTARLESLLIEFRGFKPEDVKQKVTARVRYEISDVTEYLFTRYGIKVLEPMFPKITTKFKVLDEKFKEAQKVLNIRLKKGSNGRTVMPVATREEYKKIENIFQDKPRYFPYFVTHELGFKFFYAWDYSNEHKYPKQNDYLQVGFSGTEAFDIRGYDYMGDYYGNTYSNDIKKYFENIGVTVTYEGYILTIQKGEEKIIIDLDTYIKEMIKKHGNRAQNLTQKDLTIEKENEKLKMKIEFRHLQKNGSNRDKSIKFGARILFKLKGEQ